MITLKLATYSEEERAALQELFEKASTVLEEKWCGGVSCTLCKYRHLCNDFRTSAEFAAKYAVRR